MANKKISDISIVATTLTGASFEIEQDGASKQFPASIIETLYNATPAAYTTTLGSDLGGGVSSGLRWLRIGKCIRIFGSVTFGTTSGGSDVWFSIPSGINLDTSAGIVSRVTKLGESTRLTSGSNGLNANIHFHLCYDSSLGATKIRFSFGVSSGVYEQNAGSNFNSSEVVNIDTGLIPIAEW